MVVVPAVGLGALVVFGVGYVVMYVVLEAIAKRRNRVASKWWGYLTEKNIERTSLVGGGIAVVLVVLLMVGMPKRGMAIWTVLTVLGILFGLLTFLLKEPTT